MTKELEVYYFPERAQNYSKWLNEPDLYAKKIEEHKSGKHHDH